MAGLDRLALARIGDHRERPVLVGAAFAILATLALSVPSSGGAMTSATAHRAHLMEPRASQSTIPTLVTAGSQWTYYQVEDGVQNFCTVVPFGPRNGPPKSFTDDIAGAGTWSSGPRSTKITWTSGNSAGFVFKGSWMSGLGYRSGSYTKGGIAFGPVFLAPGVNPVNLNIAC